MVTVMTDATPARSATDAAPARTPRPRRTRPATLERREEILRAAMRVFGSKGYHQGSLAEVAEQVGITHAGVLHHLVKTAAINAERPGIVQAYTVLTGEGVTDGHPASAWVTERFTGLRADIAG